MIKLLYKLKLLYWYRKLAKNFAKYTIARIESQSKINHTEIVKMFAEENKKRIIDYNNSTVIIDEGILYKEAKEAYFAGRNETFDILLREAIRMFLH